MPGIRKHLDSIRPTDDATPKRAPLPAILAASVERTGAADVVLPGRTNAGGLERFGPDEVGILLIACLQRIEAFGGLDADWESYRASLIFDLPAPPSKQVPVGVPRPTR